MRVLVTGGGGFLGRHIARDLIARGDKVVSAARGAYPELEAMGVEQRRLDLSEDGSAERAVEGCEAVIHTAAKVDIWGEARAFEAINVEGTRRLLETARAAGARRFVYTSSPSVTFDGTDAEGAGPELGYSDRFLAHYPRTKAAGERLVLAANSEGMRTCALRPHLIWGPGDPHLIPRLLERARSGRLAIVGDGENVVDLTYIDNAAEAHLLALDALGRGGEPSPAGKAYFISNGEPVALWPWINDLLEALAIRPIRRRVPRPVAYAVGAALEAAWGTLRLAGEPPMTRFVADQLAASHYYDMAPAERDFGYVPRVSMAEGKERLVASLGGESGTAHGGRGANTSTR